MAVHVARRGGGSKSGTVKGPEFDVGPYRNVARMPEDFLFFVAHFAGLENFAICGRYVEYAFRGARAPSAWSLSRITRSTRPRSGLVD